MSKLVLVNQLITNRKTAIVTGLAVIFVVIIDLFMTCQILSFTDLTEFCYVYLDHSHWVCPGIFGSSEIF